MLISGAKLQHFLHMRKRLHILRSIKVRVYQTFLSDLQPFNYFSNYKKSTYKVRTIQVLEGYGKGMVRVK